MSRIILLSLIAVSLVSCGDNKDLNIKTNLNVFDLASNAFNSAAIGIDSSKKFGVKAVTCDTTGEPTSTSPGDTNYAGEKVYCQFAINSKSPDTVQGSYFVVSSVLCAIEKQHSFNYSTTATIVNGLNLDETDSCFGSGGFDINGDSTVGGVVPISIRESSLTGQDHDYFVELQLGAATYNTGGNNDVELYLKDSNGVLGAKIYQNNSSVTEVVVDLTNLEVLFENRDWDNTRHLRVKIDGDFNPANGNFTSISLAKAIFAESSTTVQFGFDGSAEWYDHYVTGSQDADYDQCNNGPCTSITTTFSSSFYTFPANSSAYDNANLLNLNTFDMSF